MTCMHFSPCSTSPLCTYYRQRRKRLGRFWKQGWAILELCCCSASHAFSLHRVRYASSLHRVIYASSLHRVRYASSLHRARYASSSLHRVRYASSLHRVRYDKKSSPKCICSPRLAAQMLSYSVTAFVLCCCSASPTRASSSQSSPMRTSQPRQSPQTTYPLHLALDERLPSRAGGEQVCVCVCLCVL